MQEEYLFENMNKLNFPFNKDKDSVESSGYFSDSVMKNHKAYNPVCRNFTLHQFLFVMWCHCCLGEAVKLSLRPWSLLFRCQLVKRMPEQFAEKHGSWLLSVFHLDLNPVAVIWSTCQPQGDTLVETSCPWSEVFRFDWWEQPPWLNAIDCAECAEFQSFNLLKWLFEFSVCIL